MRLFASETHLIPREDVLALLEDGPKPTGVLATWLSQPTPRVHAALSEMGRAGLVKRVGLDHRWALISAAQPQPAKPIKRSTSAPLRHPTETPARIAVNPEESLSWWVGKSREELGIAALARQAQMQASKESLKVPFRILL